MTRRQRRAQRAGRSGAGPGRKRVVAPLEAPSVLSATIAEDLHHGDSVPTNPPLASSPLCEPPPDSAQPSNGTLEECDEASATPTNTPNDVEQHEAQQSRSEPAPEPVLPMQQSDVDQPQGGLRRRIIRFVALGLCLAVIGGVLVVRTLWPAAPATRPVIRSEPLPIDVAKQAHVGDAITVTVGPAAVADGQPATLTMVGSYGPRLYRATFAAGRARFLIPGGDTQQSGLASLIASAGASRGEASLMLAPDAAVDPVTPLVGARSIIADAQHWSMGVAVPFDRFGNPLADGAGVDFRALHPGDQLELQHTQVHTLVAWARITSRTHAGRTTVSVTADGKSGSEATFTEVPGWPAPFALSASPANAPADGRQFVTLRTDAIRDRFGNAMLDGTLVTFVVDMPGGEPRMIPAYTIDGIAKAQLQAPSEPGQLSVRAVVYAAESRPLQLTFTTGIAVSTFPVEARVEADDQEIALVAGPMLGPMQQFVPDGTPVQFLLTDASGQQTHIAAVSASGYARVTARLASLPFGAYTAEVKVGAGSSRATFQVP